MNTRNTKIFLAGFLIFLCIGCSGQVANNSNAASQTPETDKYRLPSGREIKITGMNGMNFENGETGLILQYQTDIPIENHEELKKEVEEVWTIFRYDVEKANTTTGIIRATHIEEDGVFVKHGKGFGFLYRKDAKGNWQMDDEKK